MSDRLRDAVERLMDTPVSAPPCDYPDDNFWVVSFGSGYARCLYCRQAVPVEVTDYGANVIPEIHHLESCPIPELLAALDGDVSGTEPNA